MRDRLSAIKLCACMSFNESCRGHAVGFLCLNRELPQHRLKLLRHGIHVLRLIIDRHRNKQKYLVFLRLASIQKVTRGNTPVALTRAANGPSELPIDSLRSARLNVDLADEPQFSRN